MAFNWLQVTNAAFDPGDMDRIVTAALRIARQVPWTIDGPPAYMAGLAAAGFAVDGTKVRLTDRLIDDTMAAIAEHKRANPPTAGARVADRCVGKTATGQAALCCDPETGTLRDATHDDLARFSHLVDAIPGLRRDHPTFIPQDAPNRTRDLHALVTLLLNSSTPYRVSAYSAEILPFFIEAYDIYCGSREEAIRRLPRPCRVYINTPFCISREAIEAALVLESLTGTKPDYASMPVLGAATPVTLAGALALSLAEGIGANAISLAVHGQLTGWSCSPTELDLRSAAHTQWGPACLLFTIGVALLRCHVFGGDYALSLGATTAAKVPDVQSVMETATNLALAFAGGCRHFASLATLAFADVGSPVQLMLELELLSALEASAQGFAVDDESLAIETIIQVAPQGAHFLDSDHTLHHYRQSQWYPEFMDRQVPYAWIAEPRPMLERAREKAVRLWHDAPNLSPLDDAQRQELERLLLAADRELG